MTPEPASRSSASSPPSIPGWNFLRAIGRGSYGEVWLAQGLDGNFRAVKVISRKTFDNDRPYQRELSGIRRFEPISRGHPSQVAIFSVGEDPAAGLFYYVMELADDAAAPGPHTPVDPATYRPKTLKSESSRRGRLPFGECLEIGIALATALDHLHQHGLIHRDIKPSNVIFVGGVPKLADIGLVTDLDASVSFVGTEGFLPPEGPGTSQGDIYSLGKVLYEISTGQDRMEFPELPTILGDTAEREQLLEVNQILLKACQNDLRHRYRSARDLLADLQILHEGRSLRRTRATETRLRQARGALVAVGLIAGLLISGNYLLQQARIRRFEQEMALAAEKRQFAEELATQQTHRLALRYAASGEELRTIGDWFGAAVFFENAVATEMSVQPRPHPEPHLHRIQSVLAPAPGLAMVLADTNHLTAARYSPLAPRMITVDQPGKVRIWDTSSGDIVSTPKTTRPIQTALLAADGERAVLVDDEGAVYLASPSAPTLAAPLMTSEPTGPIALSPAGRQVAVVRGETNLVVLEISSRRERFSLPHLHHLTSITFSPDGNFIATGSADGSVRIWSADRGEAVAVSSREDGSIESIAFSQDGRRLLSVNPAGARIHDTRSGETAPHPFRHDGPIRDAVFSPDGRLVLTAGQDRTARVWDSMTGRVVASLLHEDAVLRGAFSPDRRFILTATASSGHLWRDRTFKQQPPVLSHGGRLLASGFDPSGRQLFTLSQDGAVRIFDLDRPFPAKMFENAAQMPTVLGAFTQLLAGRRMGEDENLHPLDPASVGKHWRTLEKMVRTPAGPDDAPFVWHWNTARAAGSNQLWFAAVFHWEQALRYHGNDREAQLHLETARSNLAREMETAARPGTKLARIPPRDPNSNPRLLDLSGHFNAPLTAAWLPALPPSSSNDLSSLPTGVTPFNGIEFDVRGLIQLSSPALEIQGGEFPRQSNVIPVNRACRRLHFLHGAVRTSLVGTTIGSYVVTYEDGQTHEIKIVFGRDVREWWSSPTQQALTTGAAVAWEGSNPAAAALGFRLRLFQMQWVNPRPDSPVRHIDFRSAMESSAPFLLAITADP